jgi:hypothetical protein
MIPPFKNIIVLENEDERDANNSVVNRCLNRSFAAIPVTYWYRFYRRLTTESPSETLKSILAIPQDTLLLTYTTFENSVMSGYGDLLGSHVETFRLLMELNKKLSICVICMPPLRWQLIEWVTKGERNIEQAVRKAKLIKLLDFHNIYSLDYGDARLKSFYEAAYTVTGDWFQTNCLLRGSLIYNEAGEECSIYNFFPPDLEIGEPAYSIWQSIQQEGKRASTLPISTIKKYNP